MWATTSVVNVSFSFQLNQINHTIAMILKYIVGLLGVDIVHIWIKKFGSFIFLLYICTVINK